MGEKKPASPRGEVQKAQRRVTERGPVTIRLYRDSATDHPESNRLGEILRLRREGMGLTHREVAAVADVSVSYVGMVERGERRPTKEKLLALLAALGIEGHDHGPRAVDFSYGKGLFRVHHKAPNLVERSAWGLGLQDPETKAQRRLETQARLGRLLARFAAHPAAAKVAYKWHCSGDPDMSDSDLPDPDAILGELAEVLVGNPLLSRRLDEMHFSEVAKAPNED